MSKILLDEEISKLINTIIKSTEFKNLFFDLDVKINGINVKETNVIFSLEQNEENLKKIEDAKNYIEKKLREFENISSVTGVISSHKNKSENTDHQNNLLSPAKNIVAVASGKGGVGKSTTSINLALSLLNNDKKVGILDADIYGPSIPKLIGLNKRPKTEDKKIIPHFELGLQVMSIGFLVDEDAPTIWRGPMVMSAVQQMLKDVKWSNLDYLIIDLPPGTGDAQLTLTQKVELSGAVIVSTPQDLALIDARKALNMFRKVNVPILGIIENMSHFICPFCSNKSEIFGNGGARNEAKRIGVNFLGEVPIDMAIRETSDSGKPIVSIDSNSYQSKSYNNIALNVIEEIEKNSIDATEIKFE